MRHTLRATIHVAQYRVGKKSRNVSVNEWEMSEVHPPAAYISRLVNSCCRSIVTPSIALTDNSRTPGLNIDGFPMSFLLTRRAKGGPGGRCQMTGAPCRYNADCCRWITDTRLVCDDSIGICCVSCGFRCNHTSDCCGQMSCGYHSKYCECWRGNADAGNDDFPAVVQNEVAAERKRNGNANVADTHRYWQPPLRTIEILPILPAPGRIKIKDCWGSVIGSREGMRETEK